METIHNMKGRLEIQIIEVFGSKKTKGSKRIAEIPLFFGFFLEFYFASKTFKLLAVKYCVFKRNRWRLF
jgi:hypothetical protein